MRVLIAIKALGAGPGGGAERVVAAVAGALARRGHEVDLLTFDPPEAVDFYPVDDAVERVRLGIGAGLRSATIGDFRRAVRALRMELKRRAPSVAVGFMHSAYIPLGFAASRTGIPVVAAERTSFLHYRSRPAQLGLLTLAAPLFARMTINSHQVREGYPGVLRRRLDVIPNPVSKAVSLADPVGEVEKTLLSVGGLRPEKDHATLLRAFAGVAADHPDWRLRLVGEGPLRVELTTLSNDLGIGSRTMFAGPTSDVDAEYANAQLFALPSRYEAFPNCLAEALAHGLPAIAFKDCEGAAALISDGLNGILAGGDERVAALKNALDRLMRADQWRLELGRAGPRSVERFTLDSVVDQWESLLSSTVRNLRTP